MCGVMETMPRPRDVAAAVRAKLLSLERELNAVVYERAEVIRGMLLALLASDEGAPIPMVLVGAPGTSKTMLAEALCEAIGASYFEWLMNPSTLPDEIFGPIRASLMVEKDEVRRNPKGKLPDHVVVLLDEIFQGNEATLNLLLPVLAKGEWFNGEGPERLPLRLFLSATNRVPDVSGDQPMLAALWDRFVLRYVVRRIQDADRFSQMLRRVAERRRNGVGARLRPATHLTLEEIDAARQSVRNVNIEPALDALAELWRVFGGGSEDRNPASDRRWGQYIAVLQAQAFLAGRDHVVRDDLAVLQHCLWRTPEEIPAVMRAVAEFLTPWAARLEEILAEGQEQIDRFYRLPEDDREQRLLVGGEVGIKLGSLVQEIKAMMRQEEARTGTVPEEMRRALAYLTDEGNKIYLVRLRDQAQ